MRSEKSSGWASLFFAVLSCTAMWLAEPFATHAVGEEPTFNGNIRSILSENCFQCHGPDADAREADLRLDVRESAIAKRDAAPAIRPGNANASELIHRLTTEDADLKMPPASTGKTLSAEQIELLRRWIDAGAEYQKHWSFQPVERHRVPPSEHADWAHNAIDYFVLERLHGVGLRPSPTADRQTLIRRVYLDLLGVLPAVDEVNAFVADAADGAYERLVDRVLASPKFGERWGRHWLDQARYADSHGYTNDNERVMWPYRDWVIRAVNRDLPFDRFTIEQLAGDLLPEATIDQQIASGFHRNTLINTEGGTKADQFRDEQVKDRVDTTGNVWLGISVGCAKCHSHKYDPISMVEYYQIYAFFNSTADNNSVPPVIKAPTIGQQVRLAELNARHTELQRQLSDDSGRADRRQVWEAAVLERTRQATADEDTSKTDWTVLELDGKSQDGATFKSLDDGSLLASGTNTVADFYELTALSPLTTIRSVRLEVLTHDELPKSGPGRASNGNFVLAEFWFRTGDGRELRFSKAQADHSQPKWDVGGTIDNDNNTGWAINGSPEGGPNHNRTAWYVLPRPLEVEDKHALTFNLQHHKGASPYNIGRLRISLSADEWVDAPSESELAKIIAIPADKRGAAQRKRIEEAFLRQDAALGPAFDELQTVTKQRDKLSSEIASTMVMKELDRPRPTRVHQRGNFLNPGDEVAHGVPASLPQLASTDQARSRLDLASWLVRDDNPLTPRVRINRLWMRMFGRGLVETENDFGTQGSLPTHPKLLDWLAAEQIRRSWSTKQMLRLIATSATYRQRSHVTGDGLAVDPRNELLWRQNRVRVEGEVVRDLALSAGGLLSGKIGGPSVYPPQPDGVYAFTQRKKNWQTSPGEDRYRRGMYTFFYRSAPYPMLTTFDAPKFNQTCTRRDRSNTPLQSLTVANDPTMVEAARALAARVVATDDQTPDRIERMFRTCLVRLPNDSERRFLANYFDQQRQRYAAQSQDAAKVVGGNFPASVSADEGAALIAVGRVLLNLDEFITRE